MQSKHLEPAPEQNHDLACRYPQPANVFFCTGRVLTRIKGPKLIVGLLWRRLRILRLHNHLQGREVISDFEGRLRCSETGLGERLPCCESPRWFIVDGSGDRDRSYELSVGQLGRSPEARTKASPDNDCQDLDPDYITTANDVPALSRAQICGVASVRRCFLIELLGDAHQEHFSKQSRQLSIILR